MRKQVEYYGSGEKRGKTSRGWKERGNMAQLKSAENMLQLEKEAEQTEIKGAGMQKTKVKVYGK